MSDIELVIKLSEKLVCEGFERPFTEEERKILINAIGDGIILPKGHGRLIDKDHMIARLEAASKFYSGENTDAFDERFSYGLKEAAIKVAEEPTIIEAHNGSEEE